MRTTGPDRGGELHVLPRGDITEHMANTDCICIPTPERVIRTDGGDGWVYTHHSLDGREAREST